MSDDNFICVWFVKQHPIDYSIRIVVISNRIVKQYVYYLISLWNWILNSAAAAAAYIVKNYN